MCSFIWVKWCQNIRNGDVIIKTECIQLLSRSRGYTGT